jgi:hypothetical protein
MDDCLECKSKAERIDALIDCVLTLVDKINEKNEIIQTLKAKVK